MDELISRHAAIDAAIDADMENHNGILSEKRARVFEKYITILSPALPKRGKWIPHSEKSREYIGTVLVNVEYNYWLCDTCGYRVENGQPMYNFCPNCGAKMDKTV